MPRKSVDSVLWDIRSFVAGVKAEGQSDHFLLQQFASQHDEAAFAALLQRHGPMAMGVCLRVLRDRHLAEDAFQATFLVLAIKAGQLCKRGFVAGWLYGVALRLARKLKAQTFRSRQPVACRDAQSLPDTSMEASKREEEELLDEELQRLPDKYRLPLLLCYFEGLTQEAAAAQLGWTARKVEGMLARGRERLRFRLIRRGMALSAAATVLTDIPLSAAVSKGLIVSLVEAASKLVSGQTLTTCGVSVGVAMLAKGGLTMYSKKLILIVALFFLTGTVAIGARIWAGNSEAQVAASRFTEQPPAPAPDQDFRARPQPAPGNPLLSTRMEYKTITANGNDTTELNALAREGWELFAVSGGQPYVVQDKVSYAPLAYHLQRQAGTALPAPIPAAKEPAKAVGRGSSAPR